MIFLVKTALGEFQTALSRAKTDGQIFVKKKGPEGPQYPYQLI